jgi:hypothetical protein
VYNVGLQASWEIDFWGRIRSLKDQALAQYLSTAYARKAAEISLVSQVADQYLTLLSDDDLLKVTQDTLKTAQDSYNLTKISSIPVPVPSSTCGRRRVWWSKRRPISRRSCAPARKP